MPAYGDMSIKRLSTCHPDLQRVFFDVIKHVDHTILVGHRNQADQDAAYASGASQKLWPASTHNFEPSRAVDAIRYPVDWSDLQGHILFAGFVIGTARSMGIPLRWGGDWNRNWSRKDEKFADLVHFELVP